MTVKWDGVPAVICGIDPQKGDFFVGTKSVFNKVSPKICYSEEDVDKIYPPGQLADKLKPSYRYLSKLPIRGVVQAISCSLMISMLQPSVVIVALLSHRTLLPMQCL